MPTLKSTGKRSFTINNAYHIDGCKTKFSHKDYTGRFVGKSAQRAASKALTELCHAKRIHGQCTLYIEMRETTQGSKHKVYAYKAKRVKYSEPVMYGDIKREYHNVIKSVRIPTENCKKSHKSSGRMRSFRGSRGSHSSKSKMSKKHHSKTKKHSKK